MTAAYKIIVWVFTFCDLDEDSFSNSKQLTSPTRYLRRWELLEWITEDGESAHNLDMPPL